jgi:HEAT repeat protein
MLLDHDNPDVRAEAALALGKVSGGDAVAFLSRLVHDANAHVRHIAVLAMGLTGDASAFPELARFLLDTQRYAYDRAFAAIGLGLLGAPEAGPVLAKVLAEKDRTRDIHGAALYALAFLGDEASLEILSEYAEDPAKDEFLRGAAHVALGKTGDLSRRRILLSGLRDKSVNVRRSAATALANLDFTSPFLARRDALARTRRDMKSAGILTANAEKALDQQLAEIDKATQEDERRLGALRTQILFELVDVIANDSDVMVRNFASIALGRIGGPHASRELVRHYKKTSDASGKSFAVLSLGLANAVDALPLLRKELESSNVDVSAKGAIVIAIGLLKDEKSLGRIADLALGRGDPSLRGYAAIAAGMIGDASVIRDFRKVLTSRTNPELMPDFGLALGMLGDRDAVDPLGTLLNGPDTATIHIQASRALGSIADSSAIQHLLDALASKKLETQAVAAAARALGVVAEKGDLPLLTPMARDYNYLLDIESMNEILVQ